MFKYHTILEITFHYFIEKKSMQREKVKQNKFRPKHSFKALFINRRRQTQQQLFCVIIITSRSRTFH